MDERSIYEITDDVFGRNTALRTIGGWVSMRCPLAQWKHPKGRDSMPSAGISVNDNGTSIFNCFTCGRPRPFHAMLREYADLTGEDLGDLIDELEDEAYLGARTLPDWQALKGGESDVLMPLDEAIYGDLYESAAGHPYLRRRGISDATAELLELKFDPCDPADKEPRILFPVRGPDGLLYGFSGRAIRSTARLKVRDYCGLPKAKCLLGSHLIERQKAKHVLIVEGLFDYANGWECGQPTCAVMHSTLTEHQAEIVRNLSRPTYLFYDNDAAGEKGVKVALPQLVDYVPTLTVRYPKIWIENPKEDNGGHWLKDPGEMEPDEFQEMISKARLC